MAHGGSHCAAPDMEAAHKGLAHIAVLAVALYLCNIQHILLHIALHHAVHNRQLHVPAIGEGHVGQRIHHQRLRGHGS